MAMEKAERAVALRKEIWIIAVPAVVESLFNTFSSIIDSRMISRVGTEAIAAISVTNQPKLFVYCIFFALNTALSALVAHAVGAKDQRKANQLAATAMAITVALSLVLGALCAGLAGPIMQVCSGQADTMALSVGYFQIIMASMVFNTSFMAINAALRGSGCTKVTMTTNIVSTLVHIALNFFIIEGRFGAPRLGVMGAGISTVVGTVAALGISLYKLMDESQFVNLRFILAEHIRFSGEATRELFALWKNICLENLLTRVGFLLASIMTARTGSVDTSIYHVTLNLMNVNFAIGDGLQVASVALVGRSVGKGDVRDVRLYTNTIFSAALGCAVVLAALYVLGGHFYYGLFSDDPAFVSRGFIAGVIVAGMTPFQIPQIIYNGVLKCMDCTRQTLYITIFTVTFLNVVLDYVLCFTLGFGLWGIMSATVTTQVTRATMLHFVYRKHLRLMEAGQAA